MKPILLRPVGWTLSLSALLLGAGCASSSQPVSLSPPSLLERLTPYRLEIQQGNVVTREQLAQVRPGMPREVVRDLLGSPMLTDVFHAQRWDYVYSTTRKTQATSQRLAVTIFFKDGVVERVTAPELPTEHQFVAAMANPRAVPKALPVLELTPEQRAKLPPPVRSEPPVVQSPQGPARTYPPLEPR